MRKFTVGFILLFIIYSVGISLYLLVLANPSLPPAYQGTAADPHTFMTPEQLKLSVDYSRIKNVIYFINAPLGWGIYLLVLGTGLAWRFRDWAAGISRFSLIHSGVYVFLLSLTAWVLHFPLSLYSFQVSHTYGISTQTFASWMRDSLISFWLNWLITTLTVWIIYALIRKNARRWWFYAWLISIPFTLLMMFVQPVIIDPLYNNFYPLQDKQLEQKILALASHAHIPADHVYEVDMSSKTNAMNAYVNGIGSNIRIVLWDTTLKKLTDDQVLFVMAHEMGHYVMNHMYWLTLGSIGLSLVGLYLGSRLLRWASGRWGRHFGIRGEADLASLPLLLLIFSVLSFAASPFANAVSRQYEHAADRYGIELTKNVKAAVGSFQQLTIEGLSEVNPPALVKWFLYNHPTMLERLHFLESYGNLNGGVVKP
jgi:Zn-dependent protease with chaperone function